jgi:TctA family transporter
MRRTGRIGIALAVFVVSFVVAGFVAYQLMLLLGQFTGVVAICCTAPEWWSRIYFLLVPIVTAGAALAASCWCSLKANRKLREGSPIEWPL